MVSTPYLTLTEMLKGTKAFSADRRKMAEVEASVLSQKFAEQSERCWPGCRRPS